MPDRRRIKESKSSPPRNYAQKIRAYPLSKFLAYILNDIELTSVFEHSIKHGPSNILPSYNPFP